MSNPALTAAEFSEAFAQALHAGAQPGRELPAPLRRAKPIARTPGLLVSIAVRHRPRGIWTEPMQVQTQTISRLQARIEAERAARALGLYPAFIIKYSIPEEKTQ